MYVFLVQQVMNVDLKSLHEEHKIYDSFAAA
jgi:hypothetical protein